MTSKASSPESETKRSARCGRCSMGARCSIRSIRALARISTGTSRACWPTTLHVSANTDPKGDRSKRPQDQDPDMMVHVVKETDAGVVLRGAKYETAASYADQAFLKPTVGAWTDEELSDYAVGCIVRMGAPGVRPLCRSGFAERGRPAGYPLTNRFDEVDTL